MRGSSSQITPAFLRGSDPMATDEEFQAAGDWYNYHEQLVVDVEEYLRGHTEMREEARLAAIEEEGDKK